MALSRLTAVLALSIVAWSAPVRGESFVPYPQQTLFMGFDLGVGLNPDQGVRSPVDLQGLEPEAYSLSSFLFGLTAGYRFNELVGLEVGWHEQQHRAHSEWGGAAFYQLSHLALRLAWPTPSRQTPLLKLGGVFYGTFAYGDTLFGTLEDNGTYVGGGFVGLALEHEFTLGLVGVFEVSYLPLYRVGMNDELFLSEERCNDVVVDGETLENCDWTIVDSKDYSKGQFIQLIWLSLGIQFEWTFR